MANSDRKLATEQANCLYYGDNLDSLRKHIRSESIDFCYIDPPFNSKRTYNQIYNRIGLEDRAQAQAFVDTWIWDEQADEGFREILTNETGRFPVQTVELMKGLRSVLGKDSLLAYLVSMTRRIVEIHRVLRQTGSFYLHCDPTSSHYLKLVLDGIFCSQGGDFINELIWCYNVGGKSKKHFARKHDVIFWYSKSREYHFDGTAAGLKRETGEKSFGGKIGIDEHGRRYQDKLVKKSGKYYRYYLDDPKIPEDWWTDINSIQSQSAERIGYPTQKPEALMERLILTCTTPDHTILDAYCGCGTTMAVAQRLGRRWIGMDITFQSISLVLKRLTETFSDDISNRVILNGAPRDLESAIALAHKKDDRLRKEFEKWAVLSYTSNRAAINERKGADAGVDGMASFLTGPTDTGKIVFQVKSGKVSRGDIAKLNSDRQREGADLATLITLEEPTAPMRCEARAVGRYVHPFTGKTYPVISVVTVKEMIEANARLDMPLTLDALKVWELYT